jgi:hypothetical protein
MAAVKESLARDYDRIRERSRDDPGTAGDQAGEDWAAILRNWLPAVYPVITKGRILFEDGSSSPQIDVLALKPSYPLGLRNQKYIFAGGVVAAFECKLTLRRDDVKAAFQTASIIKRKARAPHGTPYDELTACPSSDCWPIQAHPEERTQVGSCMRLSRNTKRHLPNIRASYWTLSASPTRPLFRSASTY